MAKEKSGSSNAPEVFYTFSYKDKEKSIKFGQASITVMKSPYSKEYELAVKPSYLENGELTDIYSYKDDLLYAHCLKVIRDCELGGKEIPPEIDRYARTIFEKRKSVNELIKKRITEATGDINAATDFPMNKWRDDLLYEPKLRQMLEDYKKTHI